MDPIILASQSPRRKQLLQWAEIPFDVIVHDTDESYPPDLSTDEVPVHIARAKCLAVHKTLPSRDQKERIVLAADTVVVLKGDIIGKPRDRDDAIAILSRLQGREHQVITGVCAKKGAKERTFADLTRVVFHPLTNAQLAYYVDQYQPYDKAGAYAIQEWIGVVGIQAINGDFYNVMGLPVSRVIKVLEELD
jgi:septum formation protein